MRSIGIDLEPAVRRRLLRFHASRPATFGLEMHLVAIHKAVSEFKPRVVVIDPVSNFAALGSPAEVKAMMTRVIDFFKMEGITALITSLNQGDTVLEATEVGVSSLMDNLAAAGGRAGRCGAQSAAPPGEIARHGPLEPGPRVPAHR